MSFLALVLVFLGACGGPPDAASAVTIRLGRAIHSVDLDVAHQATRESETAIQYALATIPEPDRLRHWDRHMAPWHSLTAGIRIASNGWATLDDALRAWEASADGGERAWVDAAACVFGALMSLSATFHSAGLDPPQEMLDAAQALAAFIDSDRCISR